VIFYTSESILEFTILELIQEINKKDPEISWKIQEDTYDCIYLCAEESFNLD